MSVIEQIHAQIDEINSLNRDNATLRARVAELEAEREPLARSLMAYRVGAEAMRERAAREARGWMLTASDWRRPAETIADAIGRLPLTDDAREDGGSGGE